MNLKNWQCLSSIPVLGGIINSFSDKLAGFIQSGFLHLHVGNLDCINETLVRFLNWDLWFAKMNFYTLIFLFPAACKYEEHRGRKSERAYLNVFIQLFIYFDMLLCVNAQTVKYMYAGMRMYSIWWQTYCVLIKSAICTCTHANIPNVQTTPDPLYKT